MLLLVEKSRLHSLVRKIDDVGLRSGVRFAVMALVVLPLLPEGPFGPFGGVRPRQLWLLVLFFSGLSFAGYVARRIAGTGRGYLVTGLLGGLVSSTNVTFTFARSSRTDPALEGALALGAVAANAMLFPRLPAGHGHSQSDYHRRAEPLPRRTWTRGARDRRDRRTADPRRFARTKCRPPIRCNWSRRFRWPLSSNSF